MLESVPVIDLRDFSRDRSNFIYALGDSIRYFGFVRVKGHNVDVSVMKPAYRVAREFFHLSESQKNKYKILGGAGQRAKTPLCERRHRHTMPCCLGP